MRPALSLDTAPIRARLSPNRDSRSPSTTTTTSKSCQTALLVSPKKTRIPQPKPTRAASRARPRRHASLVWKRALVLKSRMLRKPPPHTPSTASPCVLTPASSPTGPDHEPLPSPVQLTPLSSDDHLADLLARQGSAKKRSVPDRSLRLAAENARLGGALAALEVQSTRPRSPPLHSRPGQQEYQYRHHSSTADDDNNSTNNNTRDARAESQPVVVTDVASGAGVGPTPPGPLWPSSWSASEPRRQMTVAGLIERLGPALAALDCDVARQVAALDEGVSRTLTDLAWLAEDHERRAREVDRVFEMAAMYERQWKELVTENEGLVGRVRQMEGEMGRMMDEMDDMERGLDGEGAAYS